LHIDRQERSMGTAYVYDPIYLEHDLPSHPENAGRLRSVIKALEESDIAPRLELLKPRPATAAEVERVHTRQHVERVRAMAQSGGGHLDADTYVCARSYDAAVVAAGGVVRAVEAVLAGEVESGFALVRPPGHHATADRAMGFCLFNNVAVAARAALADPAVERVFIADFDVHHGNGTEETFGDDPAVFYFSTHQYPYYPGTGHWRDSGRGAGEGTVLNVPLLPGVGDAGYAHVYEQLVWPLIERFSPHLILVSAGYDAHWKDPLAGMMLSLTGYAALQRELVHMAGAFCDGRIVFTLEGGYRREVLAAGVLNAFYAMLGEDRVLDPLGVPPTAGAVPEEVVTHLRILHGLD
jgi:acetoin utilization deacetylase AcuC-like enzyme